METLSVRNMLLMMAAGPATSIPLMMYTRGVNELPLTTMGFLQYISPTLMLLTGVLFLGESFTPEKTAAFAFIWAGLALFSVELVRKAKKLTVHA